MNVPRRKGHFGLFRFRFPGKNTAEVGIPMSTPMGEDRLKAELRTEDAPGKKERSVSRGLEVCTGGKCAIMEGVRWTSYLRPQGEWP